MGAVKSVGPNQALVISGSFKDKTLKRVVSGGWLWKSVGVNAMKISLNLLTVYPKCYEAETSQGVQLYVSGAAHVKVKRELVKIAAEQFGGKNEKHIKAAIQATLEGHLRSILSSLTVEEAYKDRLKFAQAVREEAETDLEKMGFTIMSFVILDLTDDVGYFESLGKTEIANVKGDAAVGIAESERDASVREFECFTAIHKARMANDSKIADGRRKFEAARYGYQSEMQSAKAEVDLAYVLAVVKQINAIKKRDKETEVIEERKRTEIEDLEIERSSLWLKTNVKLPTDAECFRIETIAKVEKETRILLERTERENKKILGKGLAVERLLIGSAHIDRMRLRTEVFKKHGVTAIVSQVLNTLPKIAAAVSRPLSSIEEIIMIDENILSALSQVHGALNS